VCCSALQYVAVRCSALQCFAVCCGVIIYKIHKQFREWYVPCCSVVQCVAVWCNVVQCVAACCSVLQRVAVCCSIIIYQSFKLLLYIYMRCTCNGNVSSSRLTTGWRRLIESPKFQILFHKRATKYRSILRKMTYKDKGSYESSPPCNINDTHTYIYVCIYRHIHVYKYVLSTYTEGLPNISVSGSLRYLTQIYIYIFKFVYVHKYINKYT